MTVLRAATDLLASRWGVAVAVHAVWVDHRDRSVIRSVDPLGRPVVIKADRNFTRLQSEARALAAVAAAGVPVPLVLEQMDTSPAVLVLEYVRGQSLSSTSGSGHWREVGRQLRRLHDHASPKGFPVFGGEASWWGSLRSLAEQSHRWCRERQLVNRHTLDRLAACMRDAFARDDEPGDCLVHGDCGPYHWLLRKDTVVAVLDFGDAARGDPCWDLAVLTLNDRDRLAAVLDGYDMDKAMRDHLESTLVPYTVIRHLLAIWWLVEHDFDPAPTVAELDRLAR
ncbi:MAG TPA: aminoglycoside phosphotransferase family protein [Candidatus Limnocylindrales bacterium]|nr:aminoglycoside phosphotransferase family protein [Candidatus Limnocylindrales bacterium]